MEQDVAHREDEKRFAQLERELHMNEARWRAVIENPFMGITILDKNHNFLATNSTFQAMVGYTQGELKKLTPLDITPVEDREINRTLFRELQQGDRNHYELVKRLQRKDGKPIWIQLYVFGIPDQESPVGHIFGMTFDITEKMQAQDALQSARAELTRFANVSRMGAMIASIAHEINQPLSGLVSSANAALRWLAQTPADLDKARESLNRIVRGGQRATAVVEGIRTMFKSKELTRASIDVNELVNEVLELANVELRRRGIVVKTELHAMLAPVSANRVQVQQVLFNLVTNAIEAMEAIADPAPLLQIKTEPENDSGVRVTVEDSGTGIDPENIDRIFNAFFTTKDDGTGMGLAICRSIIDSHGGHLSVSSGHPHGAVFRFTLPAGSGGE